MPAIEYFFTLVSPFAYLGHRKFLEIVAAHGGTIVYRPVMLAKVFENSGAVPLAERPKARQEYRFLELQRWRAKRGVALNLKPKHFPTSPALADRALIGLVEGGEDPGAYAERVFRACWVEDKDIAERAIVAEALIASGHDAEAILAAAESAPVQARYVANSEAAIALKAIGSPTYVLSGEVFWGQDRLELLEDAMASGRPPYRVPA